MKYRIFKTFILVFIFTLLPFSENTLLGEENKNEVSADKISNNIQNDLYILGPGDIIAIQFVGASELSSEFQILSDGNIQLPLVGSQTFTGLTLDSAKKKLIRIFENELLRPDININLVSMRPLKISIIGEVYRPGIYSLNNNENTRVVRSEQANNLSGFPTVVDAIQKAGGLTLEADISNLTLYRELSGNEKKFKKVKLNLLKIFQTGNQEHNPHLFDGDIVKIPKFSDPQRSIEDIPNNLIPDKINIYVVGEVANPGMYQVSVNTTVNKAILIAGGPISWKYQKNNINLLRVKRDGDVESKKLNFDNKNFANKKRDISLRNGDIIRVNKNLFGKSTSALSTILPPIRDLYSLYGVYKVIED